MNEVVGVDFGGWNTAVFWLVKYLQSRFGTSCVYKPAGMPELRTAFYPAGIHSPVQPIPPLDLGTDSYGVFVRIQPVANGNTPEIKRPRLAASNPAVLPISDPNAYELIERWASEVKTRIGL